VQHAYLAYGRSIDSEIVVPEFVERTDGEKADIYIRLHPEQPPPETFANRTWFFEVSRARATLYFSGVAVFLLEDGKNISIKPVCGADYRLIELYLAGTVFSVLLYQLGLLVVHASAVILQRTGTAVLLMGESGAGKSSLAAALVRRGNQCLCDDVSGLLVSKKNREIRIVPAFPYLKIDQDLLNFLQFESCACRPVHDSEAKLFLSCQHTYCGAVEYPVQGLFLLQQGEKTMFQPLSAGKAMIELIRYSVPTRLLRTQGDVAHFRQCGAVASSVPVWRLLRDNNRNNLIDLADQVESKAVHDGGAECNFNRLVEVSGR